MTGEALLLLAGLLVAHWAGDFTPLATVRMHAAKANGGPLHLIGAHALVHAVLVGAVVGLIIAPTWTVLSVAVGLEFATHFAIDTVRGQASRRFPTLGDPRRGPFWYALGVDQLAHTLVLLVVADYVLRNV